MHAVFFLMSSDGPGASPNFRAIRKTKEAADKRAEELADAEVLLLKENGKEMTWKWVDPTEENCLHERTIVLTESDGFEYGLMYAIPVTDHD